MLLIRLEDLFERAEKCRVLTTEEQIQCAVRMKDGDASARQALIDSYLPSVAGHIRRMNPDMQTLNHALHCVAALEKTVDTFNFFQDGEPFRHRLSWALRQATTRYIVRDR